jgi:diguanylate cyclase (GGDEF)-like protein
VWQLKHIEENRKNKVNQVVGIIKLCSVIFCGIILMTVIVNMNDGNAVDLEVQIPGAIKDLSIVTLAMISIGVLLLVYMGWSYFTRREKNSAMFEIKIILETAALLVINSFLVALTGAYRSPYKFIYLFLIIITTIQFGTALGITVACAAAGFLFSMDLLLLSPGGTNTYFETDLVLSGLFIFISWLIGYYVKIEEEHRKSIEGLINTDSLTGLYHQKYFRDLFNGSMDFFESTERPVSLLLVDINNFRYYNELHGKGAGDEALKKVAAILKQCVRDRDVVSRYGGDEFAVILPDTTEEQAILAAERIRKTVNETWFYGEEKLPGGKLTVSIGISSFPDKAKTRAELIKGVDDALSRAKRVEKSRVETYHVILKELKADIDREHIDLINSLRTLISVINAKDNYTYSHTERVVGYCRKIATRLMLNERDARILEYGAYMHDIGKIEIPQYILNKKTPLTVCEWEILKNHPVKGAEIMKTVESLKDVVPLILYHHERYDGSGYPEGLAGDEIPLLARILTVADSYDAMTSKRPYKEAKTFYEAIEELRRCQNSQFDPVIANAFIEILIEEKSRNLYSY